MAETILEEAQRLVHGPRQQAYGHPADDFGRTGRLWGAILGLPDAVPPDLVALCLVAVKISREVNAPKRDNRVDGAGYFETLDLIRQRQEFAESVPRKQFREAVLVGRDMCLDVRTVNGRYGLCSSGRGHDGPHAYAESYP